MLTFKRILLPTDGSACSREAMHYAFSLAQQYGAQVVALHVGRHTWEGATQLGPPETSADVIAKIQQEDAAEEQRLLGEVAEAGAQAGLGVQTRHLSGSPPRMIVQFAKGIAADLVVMGTHGRSGLSRAVLGSVAEEVVRRAPCPVLVVREMDASTPHGGSGMSTQGNADG
jgi:nucleotide-binding universal stress UspA family protein